LTIIDIEQLRQNRINQTPRQEAGMFIVNLSKDRTTKNKVVFVEEMDGQPEGHPGESIIGTLYLTKLASEALGDPEGISVTIEGN
jgi:hypothetical protein